MGRMRIKKGNSIHYKTVLKLKKLERAYHNVPLTSNSGSSKSKIRRRYETTNITQRGKIQCKSNRRNYN